MEVAILQTKNVRLSSPIESKFPLPDITHTLEGIDEMVPSKEYRTWIAALDVVINCPSTFWPFCSSSSGDHPEEATTSLFVSRGGSIGDWGTSFMEVRGGLIRNNNGQELQL